MYILDFILKTNKNARKEIMSHCWVELITSCWKTCVLILKYSVLYCKTY